MYKDILFPVDLSEEGSWKYSLPVAVEYAKAFNSRLHVMTVVPNYGMNIVQQYLPKGFLEEIVSKASARLHEFVKSNIPESIEVQHIIGKGAVYECIIDTAEKAQVDLILMAAHKPELRDYLLGPNAAKVVRHSNCSVLVVRDKSDE